MAGVEFGHFDSDWLFDCLEVGSITVGEREQAPYEAPCLFLGPKGVQVAEEYLEARYRLYRMVYMHKTTRAAEKMLEALLKTATSDLKDDELAKREPVLRYFVSPSLASYLALDDASVWAALSIYAEVRAYPPDCCINRKIRYYPDQARSRLRESSSFPRKRE